MNLVHSVQILGLLLVHSVLGKLSNLKSGKVWEIFQRGGGGHRFRGKIHKLKVGNSVLVPNSEGGVSRGSATFPHFTAF